MVLTDTKSSPAISWLDIIVGRYWRIACSRSESGSARRAGARGPAPPRPMGSGVERLADHRRMRGPAPQLAVQQRAHRAAVGEDQPAHAGRLGEVERALERA